MWDLAWYLLDMKRLCSFVFANGLFECKMHFDEWMRHSFMLPQLVQKPKGKQHRFSAWQQGRSKIHGRSFVIRDAKLALHH